MGACFVPALQKVAPCSSLVPEAARLDADNRTSDSMSYRGSGCDWGVAVTLPWGKGKSRMEGEGGGGGRNVLAAALNVGLFILIVWL